MGIYEVEINGFAFIQAHSNTGISKLKSTGNLILH